MNHKTDKSATDGLTARLRRISDRPPLESSQYKSGLPSRERAPRLSTFKPAAITLEGGARMDVVVKNISDTGARIEFVSQVTLPRQVLVAEPTMRIRSWAQVIWQNNGAAGLKFLAA